MEIDAATLIQTKEEEVACVIVVLCAIKDEDKPWVKGRRNVMIQSSWLEKSL